MPTLSLNLYADRFKHSYLYLSTGQNFFNSTWEKGEGLQVCELILEHTNTYGTDHSCSNVMNADMTDMLYWFSLITCKIVKILNLTV